MVTTENSGVSNLSNWRGESGPDCAITSRYEEKISSAYVRHDPRFAALRERSGYPNDIVFHGVDVARE